MTERLGLLFSKAYGALAGMGKAAMVSLCVAVPAMAEEVTIAALGDSLTQGYGLMQEDGFTVQLQEWLRAEGHQVTVLNAGVSGDTTAGGLARVGWTLTPEVDAMIVALGGNDLLRAIPPETSRANLDGILQAAQSAGVPVLLVGLQAPGNYGPEFKAAFDAMYPELAETYGTLHVNSFFDALTDATGGDRGAAIAAYMQPDGIHPNAEGVARIVAAIGPEVERLIARASGQ